MGGTTPAAVDAGHHALSAQQMRGAMGAFASGVTIVAGIDDGEPVGFACQSFASVSLEPPLILFCAGHHGRAWPRIRGSGRFSVSVLAEDQADLCSRFGYSKGSKFDGLTWRQSRWGTPVIGGVLLGVHCDVHDVHVAGDHDVVIGKVLAIDVPAAGRRPMIFFRGGFGIETGKPAIQAPDLLGWGDRWG